MNIELPEPNDYKVILADFPWPHYGDPNKDAAAGKHYSLMTMKEIKEFPMRSLLDKKAALFLWATGPRMHLAFEAITAWDLYYRGVAYVWVKTRKDGGVINGQGVPPTFTKPTTEFLLGVSTTKTGRPLKIYTQKQPQVTFAPREGHSVKPAVFHNNIVELFGDVKRLELFARKQVEGWDCWGNEVNKKEIENAGVDC